MAYTASPYYMNPQIGQIASNLATAIFGDPEARMKRDYYNSAVEENRAQAGKVSEETRGIRAKNDATANLPTTLSALFAGPGSAADNFRANMGQAAGVLQAGGGNADQLAGGLKSLFSTAYGLGGDDDKTRSLILDGKMPDQNFAPSVARADAVATRNGTIDRTTKVDVANIGAASDAKVANINNAGLASRLFSTPLNVAEGNTVYLAPNDPRVKSTGGTKVQGNPTANTVRGAAGQRILDGDKRVDLPGLFNGSGGVPKPGAAPKPHPVTGKSLQDAVMAAASMVRGATAQQANGKVLLDQNFESSFPPETLAQARNVAGAILAQTGDVQQAGQAYLQALGVQPGSEFGKSGGVFGLGGHYGVTAPGAAPAPAPAPAPAAAPQAASPTNLPPPAQRPMGMEIDSPRGRVKWNGQGWVPVQSAREF